MSSWNRNGKVMPGGDVGGDYQATESYTVRYTRPDRPEAVVTVWAYGETRGNHYVITTQTEMRLCTDVSDPGGTEVWAKAFYYTGREKHRTPAAAERAARDAIDQHRASDIRWGGAR